MPNNLFVSYDLHTPGQNYDKVIAEIKKHGSWAKVHYSLFYLRSDESARQVADAVWAVMDKNDSVIVVDSTNNNAAWQNLSDEVANFIRDKWQAA